jgi:di/tricarboxylate transporter
MPSPDVILVLAVVAGAMILFITEKIRIDVTAMCVLVALLGLRLIRSDQALYGFASPATGTVAAMFVLSAGLVRTGLVQWLAQRIDRLAGKTEGRLVLILCLCIAALSAFIVNTATIAIFIPAAIVLAKSRKILPSRVLMPLSFASQFGGVCTLIGTSTNLLVNSIAISAGLAAFGLFEFAPLGLAMSGVGIIYLVFAARWLLPKRRGTAQQVDKYRLADYLAELRVEKDSSLIGETWSRTVGRKSSEVQLIRLLRGKKASWQASQTEIREGDVLLVHGSADRLIGIKDEHGLAMQADIKMNDQKLSAGEGMLIEALIPPRSRLTGRTLSNSNFGRRYGCVVLAVQRRGKVLRDRLGDIHLDGGDTLLLQATKEDVNRLMRSSDLIVTNELTELHVRKDRAIIAFSLVVGVVALAAFNVVPILVAAAMGAVGMVLGGCLTIEEAYQAIDWKVIFLLGGILPLGLALEQSGAATWLADGILRPMSGFGPLALLAALYIITAVLTEAMSNNAAAVLVAPIALSLAAAMGVNPRPFLVAITFAASTSFATPVGYQTNTMVYAPGGYRFFDYTRAGGPLNLLFWGVAVLLIPLLWPFSLR